MMNKFAKKIAIMMIVSNIAIAGTSTITNANTAFAVDQMRIAINCCEKDMTVVSEIAKVRNDPDSESRILGELKKGDSVHVTGITSNGWFRLRTTDPETQKETDGYVRSNLLSTSIEDQLHPEKAN